MGKARAVVTLVVLVLGGCADDGRTTVVPSSPVQGPVVAEVDGDPIGLGEVERLCQRTGLSPRAALERLVSERLLVQHAALQGYGELPAVERAATRAQVRALLATTVEGPSAEGSVEQQREKLASLLAELAQQSKVAYDEAAIRHAFAPDPR